jgi:hypothetical protein
MKERIVKIKDSTTGEVHEFTTPFSIKEDFFITAFFNTHFETVSISGDVCRLFNYKDLDNTNFHCFKFFKKSTLPEFYELKSKALGFDTSPQVSESEPAQETANKPTVEKKITLKFSNGQTQELTTPCAFYDNENSERWYFKCLDTHFELIHQKHITINSYDTNIFHARGIIEVKEFELIKNNIANNAKTSEPAQEVETSKKTVEVIKRVYSNLHSELKASDNYEIGVLMGKLAILIGKL